MDPNDEVMTVEEVADLLHVTIVTVRRWQESRGLPAAKIGSTTRYRRSAILEWVAAHETRDGEAKGE